MERKKKDVYKVKPLTEGKKEVISLEIGEKESSKYWLGVLNALKNRGVKDVRILCADGLSGIKESIQTAFPDTEYQRCIVHQVRNTLKHVSYKEMKALLKALYLATLQATKKWRMPLRNWGKVYGKFSIMYEGRFEEN